jgi:hypothetical protein
MLSAGFFVRPAHPRAGEPTYVRLQTETMLSADERGRPIIDEALTELIADLARADPLHLSHIDPGRILVVHGQARLESRASIRPLTFGGEPPRDSQGRWMKPRITIAGTRMLYEICLRPRFFSASPAERASIIAHELWHVARAFDGTLEEAKRHEKTSADRIDREVNEIFAAWRGRGAPGSGVLEIAGEVRMRAWLARPPSRIAVGSRLRMEYGDADLYSAVVALDI